MSLVPFKAWWRSPGRYASVPAQDSSGDGEGDGGTSSVVELSPLAPLRAPPGERTSGVMSEGEIAASSAVVGDTNASCCCHPPVSSGSVFACVLGAVEEVHARLSLPLLLLLFASALLLLLAKAAGGSESRDCGDLGNPGSHIPWLIPWVPPYPTVLPQGSRS